MNIGIVGAGKMGFTLGKHLAVNKDKLKNKVCIGTDRISYDLIGYYSKSNDSARKAADFTNSKCFKSLNELVQMCDTLFITVPDNQISLVVETLRELRCDLSGKIICHTSGACSSEVFFGLGSLVYGYSVHPIYAVNSKTDSYKKFSDSFITIEGSYEKINNIVALFDFLGHKTKVITKQDKPKYHCSAVFASNLIVGVFKIAIRLLEECGFDENEALTALIPLFYNNANNIVNNGCKKSLTGPIERCDETTVLKHLDTLSGREREVYRLISQELIDIAIEKHMLEKNIDKNIENEKYIELHEILMKDCK